MLGDGLSLLERLSQELCNAFVFNIRCTRIGEFALRPHFAAVFLEFHPIIRGVSGVFLLLPIAGVEE